MEVGTCFKLFYKPIFYLAMRVHSFNSITINERLNSCTTKIEQCMPRLNVKWRGCEVETPLSKNWVLPHFLPVILSSATCNCTTKISLKSNNFYKICTFYNYYSCPLNRGFSIFSPLTIYNY